VNIEDVDIEDILEDTGCNYHQNDTHFIIDCPECNASRKLYISKEVNRWICFKCNGKSPDEGKGNLYSLFKLLGYNTFEMRDMFRGEGVAKYCDDYIFTKIGEEDKKNEVNELNPVESVKIPMHFKKIECTKEDYNRIPEAYDYLLGRGINNFNIIKKFGLMYSTLSKRVISPFTENGVMIGYQGRDITSRWTKKHFRCEHYGCELYNKYYYTGEDNAPENCPVCNNPLIESHYPKTLNSKNLKKTIFFNQDNINWNKPVVIVEGPFDCLKTPNSIALLGKFLNDGQVKILQKKAKSVIIYMDGDISGDLSTIEIFRQLEIIIDDIKIVCTKQGTDPGQYSIKDNVCNIKESMSLFEWANNKRIII